MNTYLGAAGLLRAGDIDEEKVAASKVVYLEGYRFDLPETKQAFYRASEIAASADCKVAFSLSDRFCVEGHRAEFKRLIDHHCDIVFANEGEVLALYETDNFDDAVHQLSEAVEIACVTRGGQGSLICAGGETIKIDIALVEKVIDTTGAGDLYAAGFLYGYTQGMKLAECGRIAALAAGEVISHIGPRPQMKLSELLAYA
jgi:sugar/nucleoside kinase (ribokinase family)